MQKTQCNGAEEPTDNYSCLRDRCHNKSSLFTGTPQLVFTKCKCCLVCDIYYL